MHIYIYIYMHRYLMAKALEWSQRELLRLVACAFEGFGWLQGFRTFTGSGWLGFYGVWGFGWFLCLRVFGV